MSVAADAHTRAANAACAPSDPSSPENRTLGLAAMQEAADEEAPCAVPTQEAALGGGQRTSSLSGDACGKALACFPLKIGGTG